MQQLPASPLAQKLAESHEVDLAEVQTTNPGGTITARNVLDFLNLTAEEEAAVRRRAERKTEGKGEAKIETNTEGEEEKAEMENIKESAAGKNGNLGTDLKVFVTKAENAALDQTKAQLQATALVHQKALMQVGALRHENEVLDHEVERLRSKEMMNKAFIKELEQKKLELEKELDKTRKRPAKFAWLRNAFSK